MKKAIRLMCEVMMAAAFLLALCTVGASDAMSISHGQYVAQILISVAVLLMGFAGVKVTE